MGSVFWAWELPARALAGHPTGGAGRDVYRPRPVPRVSFYYFVKPLHTFQHSLLHYFRHDCRGIHTLQPSSGEEPASVIGESLDAREFSPLVGPHIPLLL